MTIVFAVVSVLSGMFVLLAPTLIAAAICRYLSNRKFSKES